MTINLSTLLDVTTSLVFVFFTLSLFVSGIVEFINALSEQRSYLLQLALIKILGTEKPGQRYKVIIRSLRGQTNQSPDLVQEFPTIEPEKLVTNFEQFWAHPLVNVKQQSYFGFKPISYLSADSFSTVIIDLLTKGLPIVDLNNKTKEQTLDYIRKLVADLKDNKNAGSLKNIVLPILKNQTL